ncbi:Protein of unknown function [Virgibacillus subterraneus]|uniref:DUF2929 domain-containing protein n=2 Tax=Virgibacillus TaxID=84406 RepID=A0A1H1EHX8_9BACI|nr:MULTISPECIES: DUF2929 family protein [Virgibacillus]SDQ88337.1 Protein of unknown function [Virgibacillus salinus]SEQ43650.1 Protein of unknown function [Virgibacillus subterraneus]
MRFLLPLVWALLISGVISYVLSSMAGNPFNLMNTVILAVIVTIAISILGEGALKSESEQ